MPPFPVHFRDLLPSQFSCNIGKEMTHRTLKVDTDCFFVVENVSLFPSFVFNQYVSHHQNIINMVENDQYVEIST